MAKSNKVRRAGRRHTIVVRLLLIALAVFLFLKAVQLYGQMQEKNQAKVEIDSKIQTQMVVNEGLSNQSENADERLETEAYDDGFARPGQQIYQGEAG